MSGQARTSASPAGFDMRRANGKARRAKDGDITGRIVAPVAAPPPQAAPVAPEPAPAAAEPPPRPEEIVVYWERLRRGRPLPPLADLDRALVGKGWPDSLIVIFDDEATAMPRISRLGANDGAIEYTPMVTDWILTRARQASRRATKLDEVQSFPLDGESPSYRLFLLPLGTGTGASEGVLCHLCRVA
jgi:hypothetical protein